MFCNFCNFQNDVTAFLENSRSKLTHKKYFSPPFASFCDYWAASIGTVPLVPEQDNHYISLSQKQVDLHKIASH